MYHAHTNIWIHGRLCICYIHMWSCTCTHTFMNLWTCTYMPVPCSDTYVQFNNILSRWEGFQMFPRTDLVSDLQISKYSEQLPNLWTQAPVTTQWLSKSAHQSALFPCWSETLPLCYFLQVSYHGLLFSMLLGWTSHLFPEIGSSLSPFAYLLIDHHPRPSSPLSSYAK